MATEDFKRKLTAILIADVVGYSRLMVEEGLSCIQFPPSGPPVLFVD